MLAIFCLPSFLSLLSAALCLRRLIVLATSAASLSFVPFWLLGSSARDHGGRTAPSTSFLLPDGLGFSVLVMAESVNNYHIQLAAPLPWLPQQHHPTSSQTCDDRTSAITSLCVLRPSTLVPLLLPTLLSIVSSLNHLHRVLIPARTLTEKE